MLKYIECEKFIKNGKARGKIEFLQGLNICRGEDNAENSIGKSTFLQAIDFCFGGDSYTNQNKLLEEAGNHRINFCFKFNQKLYYFSRSTERPEEISVYEKEDSPAIIITIDDFKNFLLKNYDLQNTDLSFRQVVSPFIRIFGLQTSKVKNIVGVESYKGGKSSILLNLIKLFEQYGKLKTSEEKTSAIQAEKNEFSAIENLKIVKIGRIKNSPQLKEAKTSLKTLEEELFEIIESNKIQIETVSSQRAAQAAKIEKQITILKRNRTKFLNEKAILELNISGKIKIQKDDFDELKDFFPDIKVPHIEEIQNFHAQITKIIKKETEEELEKLGEKILQNENELIDATQKLTELSIPLSIPKKVLEQYASLSRQKNELENQIDFYEKSAQIKKELKEAKHETLDIKLTILEKIAGRINKKLEELSSKINGNNSYHPTFALTSPKNYTFNTPKDSGTGTAFVSMILYDLAILELTKLPFVVHDSLLFKNISDERVIKIFEEYEKSPKQIFVSFDKESSYKSPVLTGIIKNHTVTELSYGGGELFGRSWSKKENS